MCIAIYTPKGKVLPKKHFFTSWENNQDGIGIMYADNNGLNTMKWLNEVKEAYRFYKSIAGKTNIAIHFRIGTSGNKDLTNCHPFLTAQKYGIMHNGILDINVPLQSKINDTQIFIRDIINQLPEKWAYNKAILYLLEKAIGGNKMIIMNQQGEVLILNEKKGQWKNGIWYSNDTYKNDISSFWPLPAPASKAKIYPFEHNRYVSDSEKLCEECGEKLLTTTEIENGFCRDCFETMLYTY